MTKNWAVQTVAELEKKLAERDATISAHRKVLEQILSRVALVSPHYEAVRAVMDGPDPGAELLARHAAELEEARGFADCWAKTETALNDMGMERDALRQRAEAAESALQKYGEHTSQCQIRLGPFTTLGGFIPCTCGFDDAMQSFCARIMRNGDDCSPLVKPEAPNPCEVTPKPENAL